MKPENDPGDIFLFYVLPACVTLVAVVGIIAYAVSLWAL